MSEIQLEEHIKRIIEMERRCGHSCFFRDNDDPDSILAKYQNVLEMFALMESDTREGRTRLEDLYGSGQVSAEALALFITGYHLEDSITRKTVEAYLSEKDYTGLLICKGILSKTLEEKINRNTAFSLSREHIRKAVRKRYAGKERHGFQGKGVIYTAVTGGYGNPPEPEIVNPGWDYYCLSDREDISSSVWKNIPVLRGGEWDGFQWQRRAKFFPWQFLQGYDYSVYIDGNIRITGDLQELIDWYGASSGLLCFPHPTSGTLSEEADLIAAVGKEKREILDKQLRAYYEEGYRDDRSMVSCGVLIRSHHDEPLKYMMEDWWNEINKRSRRDQMSFCYCSWKNGYDYDLCELNIFENPYIFVIAGEE